MLFWRMDLGKPEEAILDESSNNLPTESIFKAPQVWMGMIAIFLYVGVEVSTASNLPEYLKMYHDIKLDQMAPYISLFWASLMIGRWTAASGALGAKGSQRALLRWALPMVAFGLFMLINMLGGYDVTQFVPFIGAVLVLIVADLLVKGNPVKQLFLYASLGIVATLVGMYAEGPVAIYSFIAVGLFCSTLWPCIFTLAIAGMGTRTSQVSNALIMMIMGGGFVSVFQGWLSSDELMGIRGSYWVGVVCFAYLAFYAYRMQLVLQKRGIVLEEAASSGH
jgi:FHS family L-fucose permease-like MFS transporter